MKAGKLDRRIQIERARIVDDGYNETEAFAPFLTVWAQFIPSAGREGRELLGREAAVPASFRIRWSQLSAMISPGDRVRYGGADNGNVWDIKSVAEIGRRDAIELLTIAGSAQ